MTGRNGPRNTKPEESRRSAFALRVVPGFPKATARQAANGGSKILCDLPMSLKMRSLILNELRILDSRAVSSFKMKQGALREAIFHLNRCGLDEAT